MRNLLLKLYVKTQGLRHALQDESGQDLVEYALVLALIALGAVVGMKDLATAINAAFNTIATNLTANV
jgi:pilus assembly protein Flp/PilA